ncbi:hypothetical protein [Cohnella luojiensis]|uniref:Uncharacterized protein n=1 Tax=Cohnella luojiensis TaxID=652876 RepID=A0A4Y8LMP8_9BACL|nr:hypothetical protein [Cohnella luojiensis]TFE19275.1 hypothetical protein E2980_23625 [Cohnella luojiensis]
MNEHILKALEVEIEPLIRKIVLDLRPSKVVDKDTFEQLYSKLNEYTEQIKGHDSLLRSMAGKLFYLFSTMVLEAKYTNYNSEIMDEVFRLRQVLIDVFDENIMI